MPLINAARSKAILICCFALLSTACKKAETESYVAKKLIAGKWEGTGSTLTWKNLGKDTTIDYYSQWRPCEQDDLLLFYENGDGAHDENTDKCPEDNQTDPFVWDLRNNEAQLHMVIGGKTLLYSILEVSDTLLRLRYDGNDNKLGAVTYVETYKNVR